jgi:hypothetical protein
MGMASGPAFPSAAVLWGKWVMKYFEKNIYIIFFSSKDSTSRT